MRELTLYRRMLARLSRYATGRYPHNPLTMQAHLRAGDDDLSHLSQPEDTDNATLLQSPTGAFFFVLGIDSLDGTSVLA